MMIWISIYLLLGLSSFIILYLVGFIQQFLEGVLENEIFLVDLYVDEKGVYMKGYAVLFFAVILAWPLAWHSYLFDDVTS